MAQSLTLILQDATKRLEVPGLWQVIIPGLEGEAGLLPNHAEMVIALKNGIIRTIPSQTFYVVAGGLVNISATTCHVVTPYFSPISDIRPEDMVKQINALTLTLGHAKAAFEKTALQEEIALCQSVLDVFRKPAATRI